MTSLEAWQRATTERSEAGDIRAFLMSDDWRVRNKPQTTSAGKMFAPCFGALILFAMVAFWPILSESEGVKAFASASIVAGIPGGLILLACRASHGKGEARNALGGVFILAVVLILFALFLV